ncbi:coiled-coil domain-containing protein 22 homolog [Panonychus citri]|uniref:coiled-coil domain-containing protein 22 homolog n=1 Tax=Panonychus citri TaxID=50023 RepID=UPI0023071A42|nr:coiled-coil domain-containing protein 22 homolog [Panonychus citri]
MEEVDSIIIHQLKQIQGDFDEEHTSLRELDYNTIMKCLISCISLIDPELTNGLSIAPQSNMASKYKLCTSLADICVELGFKGDLGYQTFLYCNDADLRRLFLFLLEKIPKDETQDITTINLTGDTFVEKICKKPISISWTPPVVPSCQHLESSLPNLTWKTKPLTGILNSQSIAGNRIAPSKRNYYDNYARIPINDIASILEWNSASLDPTYIRLTNSRRKMIENIEFIGRKSFFGHEDSSEDSVRDNLVSSPESPFHANVTEELNQEEALKSEIATLEEAIEEAKSRLVEMETILNEQVQSIEKSEEKLKNQSDKLISMRTSDKTVSDLADEVAYVKEELASFQEQWKVISDQLTGKIDSIKEEKSIASQRRNQMIKEIHKLKKTSRIKLKELSGKDELISELQEKSRKPLPPNRSSYTQRIMELVNNVKKQNEETKKILLETRKLQKDINIVSGKVQRAYTITDETIFRDAKNSEWNRKCYKLLATMHKNYDTLLDCVNAIGTIRRETLQLEETIENERHNESIANLDRIQKDLEQLKIENHLGMSNRGSN